MTVVEADVITSYFDWTIRIGRPRDGLVLFRRVLLKTTLAHQTGLTLECELSKFV